MSKRQEIRERRQRQKQQRKMITLGAIIIGAGLIAAALVYPSTQMNNEFSSRYMAQDNAMGDSEAPIKIVEYSDYKCGHCGTFAFETEPLLEEEYVKTGKVYFVSRSVGAMLGSTESLLAAEAAYCAGEQDKYWEMHDLIYANQPSPFNTSTMNKWAKTVDVSDLDQFRSCLSDHTFIERANQDETDAKAEGVSGTPSFIITYLVDGEEGKEILPGNYPYEAFQQVIEDALKEMGLE